MRLRNRTYRCTTQDGNDPDYIEYIYSADGKKLRQEAYSLPSADPNGPAPTVKAITKVIDYVNGIQYEDADGDGTLA
ncbi:MAG: hypothetical protein AAFY71_24385 [Bacteroidota bacterium]